MVSATGPMSSLRFYESLLYFEPPKGWQSRTKRFDNMLMKYTLVIGAFKILPLSILLAGGCTFGCRRFRVEMGSKIDLCHLTGTEVEIQNSAPSPYHCIVPVLEIFVNCVISVFINVCESNWSSALKSGVQS